MALGFESLPQHPQADAASAFSVLLLFFQNWIVDCTHNQYICNKFSEKKTHTLITWINASIILADSGS